MFTTYFIFRQQKIKFKPMTIMVYVLYNRMFCCIFGWFLEPDFQFGRTSGLKPSFSLGPLLVWALTGSGPQPEIDTNRKWTLTGSGSQPEVGPNRKWVQTWSGPKTEFGLHNRSHANRHCSKVFESTSSLDPLPFGAHFRLRPKPEVGPVWKWTQKRSRAPQPMSCYSTLFKS